MYTYICFQKLSVGTQMETAKDKISKLGDAPEEMKRNEAHMDKKMKIWKRN